MEECYSIKLSYEIHGLWSIIILRFALIIKTSKLMLCTNLITSMMQLGVYKIFLGIQKLVG